MGSLATAARALLGLPRVVEPGSLSDSWQLRALDATSAAFRHADVPAVAAATARTQPARRGSLPARKAVRIAKVPSLDVFCFY